MYFDRKAKRACQSSLTFYLVCIFFQSLKSIPCILSPVLNRRIPNLVSGIPGTSIINPPAILAPILHTILPNNFFICKHFLSLKSVLKSRTKKLRGLDHFWSQPPLSNSYLCLMFFLIACSIMYWNTYCELVRTLNITSLQRVSKISADT